ncbi:MAG: hypothetical protein KGH89_09135 [Thaumarchaeota archaeon]|nr:hypothetical protein [Nitrososphaerota archaeon]MDE1867805.1 hypothetical protein [Nitrososphaerota archaeon]
MGRGLELADTDIMSHAVIVKDESKSKIETKSDLMMTDVLLMVLCGTIQYGT